jgi:hypothetical protein
MIFMSVTSPQMVSVTCPACRTQYRAPVQNIVDVGHNPRLKELLLQGRLNVGICPNCGTAGVLSVPLVYHDPDKELLFVLVPQELAVREEERQRMIGDMTNAIMNSLPPERRRGYLLRPRVFLTFQGLLEAVLEADGITKEMLQEQQEKARLLREMMDNVDDSLQLAQMIHEHEEKIDYEFFALLTANIQAAEQSGLEEAVQKLTKLRDILTERTPTGKKVAEQQQTLEKAISGLDENLTREDLLARIIAVEGELEDQILSVLLSMARPLVDYRFFQLLTERVADAEENEDTETVARLKAKRQKILDLTQQLDAQVREQMQDRAQLLSEIVRSPDPKVAVQTHLDDIDSVFMSVLEANIEQSEQLHRHEAAETLHSIRNTIVQVLEEAAPPAIRFINQLLRADYPDGTRKMLSDNVQLIDEDLLTTMEILAQDFAERGESEVSEQLRGIRAQAELLSQ